MGPQKLELRVPPVVVVAVTAGLMWVTARGLAFLDLSLPGRLPIAVALALAGGAIILAGFMEFRRGKTTVNPKTPAAASTLLTTGVYRWTRNPMYLGFGVILVGWGVWLADAAALVLLFLYGLCMNRFQIGPEERALEARFDTAFREYRERVRRWL